MHTIQICKNVLYEKKSKNKMSYLYYIHINYIQILSTLRTY